MADNDYLHTLTDEQVRLRIKSLQDEEKRRRTDKMEARRELNQRCHTKLVELWPQISDLYEHGRTSCSDDNPCNGGTPPRCVKCRLIEIVKMDVFEAEDVVIEFSARFHALKDG